MHSKNSYNPVNVYLVNRGSSQYFNFFKAHCLLKEGMSRQSRIDALGSLHHVVARGIGQRGTFDDDQDRIHFMQIVTFNASVL